MCSARNLLLLNLCNVLRRCKICIAALSLQINENSISTFHLQQKNWSADYYSNSENHIFLLLSCLWSLVFTDKSYKEANYKASKQKVLPSCMQLQLQKQPQGSSTTADETQAVELQNIMLKHFKTSMASCYRTSGFKIPLLLVAVVERQQQQHGDSSSRSSRMNAEDTVYKQNQ